MCDVGNHHLERVQLVFAEVGSLGSLPQFNHTGLPELCIRVKHRGGEKTQSDKQFTEAVRSLSSTHTLRRRELLRGAVVADAFFQNTIAAVPANHQDDLNTPTHTI